MASYWYDHVLSVERSAFLPEKAETETYRLFTNQPFKCVLLPPQSSQIALFFGRVGIHHKVHPNCEARIRTFIYLRVHEE